MSSAARSRPSPGKAVGLLTLNCYSAIVFVLLPATLTGFAAAAAMMVEGRPGHADHQKAIAMFEKYRVLLESTPFGQVLRTRLDIK